MGQAGFGVLMIPVGIDFSGNNGISHGSGTYQTSATQNDDPHIIDYYS